MKKLLLILLCLPIIGFGQIWPKTVGNFSSEGLSIIQTSDGGFMIAGSYMDAAYLIKTNSNGIEQWNVTLPQSPVTNFTNIEQTSDNGYIVCGTIRNSTTPTNGSYKDAIVIKYDENGVEQWRNMFNGSTNSCKCIKQNIDGSYTVSGDQNYSPSTPGNYNDDANFLTKLDQYGNQIWTKRFFNISGFSFDKTNDGGYILWSGDSILIKSDGFGNELWRKSLNFFGSGYGDVTIKQTSDGGYIFVGEANSGAENIIKTDQYGIVEWTEELYLHNFYSLDYTSDGGSITIGDVDGGACFDLGKIIKKDLNGITEWSYVFQDNYPECIEHLHSIKQTTDNGYIVCGWGTDSNFNERIFISKFNSLGGISSTFEISLFLTKKTKKIVDVFGRETKELKNQPLFYIYDDGTVEKKIVIE